MLRIGAVAYAPHVVTIAITTAFTAMRPDDPEHRQVLELEGCKGFIPGTAEGYDILEAAAEEEGLI